MTHLIAIETSADVCSVAAFVCEKNVGSLMMDEPRSHSRVLAPMVQELLTDRMDDRLDCIAVSAGPGSFTGLRIGVSTAKGLAFGRSARIISVPSLESVASGAMRRNSGLKACFVVSPSRKGEVYYGLFERVGNGLARPAEEEHADTISNFEGIVADHPGIDVIQTMSGLTKSATATMKPDAIEVGYCALDRLRREEFEDTSTFEPYYLKAFHAKKPKQSALDRLPF